MTEIIDAKEIENLMLKGFSAYIDRYSCRTNKVPKFMIINASDNPANKRYIKSKVDMANKVGLQVVVKEFDIGVTDQDIILELQYCARQHIPVIVQLPIYEHLNTQEILKYIDWKVDADGFTSKWMANVINPSYTDIYPATPKGVMYLLDYHCVPLKGKVALVIGTGKHVGQPLANMLMNEGCTVITANSFTKDLSSLVRISDIVISCVGKPNLIKAEDVKKDAVLIGVGFSYIDGKQVLDFDIDEVIKDGKASLVSNRINCTGKMTVLSLIDNVLELHRLNRGF